jgi:hypothetical protein
VLADRSVACWGLGDQGQIGNATIGASPIPSYVLAPK